MDDTGKQAVGAIPCDKGAWDLFSFAVVCLAVIMQAVQWPVSPRFVDIYYHLSVARGFSIAGGYVTHAFWEYAPVGRPQLYPPLLHVMMWAISGLGVSWITTGRLVEAALFPVFLLTLWWTARQTISARAAFFAVLAAFSAFSFCLSVIVFAPFTLAAMLVLWAFLAVQRERIAAALVLLAASLYSHLLMGAMGFLAVLLYGAVTPGARKKTAIVLSGSLALALPFLVHLYGHRACYSLVTARENRAVEINPLIYVLATAGLVLALKRRKALLWPVCLLAAMLPYCGTHAARFLGGHGMLAMTLLSGIALEELYLLAAGKARKARPGAPFVACALVAFLFLSPVIHVNVKDRAVRLQWFDGTLSRYLLPEDSRIIRPKENTIFFEEAYERLARIVRSKTGEDDIIWSDYSYGGGIVALLSDRATSSAMMLEIRPPELQNPLEPARLAIWFKSAKEDVRPEMTRICEQYGLREVAETDLAFVWENPSGGVKTKIEKPAVPGWLVALFAVGAVAVAAGDGFRPKLR